jgi:general secretion pathway protein K
VKARRERGVALLIALLVLALATVILAGLLDRGELVAARTRNVLREEQVEAFRLGLEAYAAQVLVRDSAEGQIDAAGDLWSLPLPPTPVPGGTITASMRDLDGCFNLNNLMPGPPPSAAALWTPRFRNLLTALELDPNITDAVTDWIDPDREVSDNGAEDNVYLSNVPAYRTANRAFVHASELRLVRGVTAAAYAKLLPYVCALPVGSSINLNTATPAVLRSLSRDITEAMAQRLWRGGQAHWMTPDAFVQELASQHITVVADASIQVQSHYFLLTGLVELDGISYATSSVLKRDHGIQVLQRDRASQ